MKRTVIIDTADPERPPQPATTADLLSALRLQLEAEGAQVAESARQEGLVEREQIAVLWEDCGRYAAQLRERLLPLHNMALTGGYHLEVEEDKSGPPTTLGSGAWYAFRFRIYSPQRISWQPLGSTSPPAVFAVFNHRHPYSTGSPGGGTYHASADAILELVVNWVRCQNTRLGEKVKQQAREKGG
jgi:hypothetical protein